MALPPPSLLQAARDTLAALDPGGDDPPSHAGLRQFLSRLYDLCLAYGTDLDEAPSLGAFVAATAADMNKLSVSFLHYPEDLLLSSKGVWEADEWRQLCQRRSGLEFMFELYRDSDAWSLVEATRDAAKGLDAFVRERGMIEGYLDDQDIDPAIPPSHWWWRLPREVPGDAGA